MLFEIQRRSPVRHRELPPSRATARARWIIPRNSDRPPSPLAPPPPPADPSRRRERPSRASLVDEFRVCCQSLFRAIISQHFDMTYKPAGGGYRGTSRGGGGKEGGGQWEAALVDAGGSIRGERPTMRGRNARERERWLAAGGSGGGCGLYVRGTRGM